MAQKTYKQIEAEANQKFGKGASKEKFEWRRSQQEAAGLEQEKRKRGGVAGTYDRNKALVQAAAPLLAGMLIPGVGAGLAGAVTGGLAKGLDRPGKGGIGLDLGAAAKGAIAGAGMGQLGGAIGSKASQFLANRAASKAGEAALSAAVPTGPITPQLQAPSMPSALPSAGGGGMALPAAGGGAATPIGGQVAGAMRAPAAGGMPSFTPSAAGQAASRAIGGMGGAAGGMAPVAPSIGAGAGAAAGQAAAGAARTGGMATVKNLLTNPQVLAGATGAVADVLGQRSQQRIAEQQLAQQGEQFQQRFGMEEEEMKRLQAQRNRLAGLFTPTRSFSNLGMGMANGNR
jgi:hypothetical protein